MWEAATRNIAAGRKYRIIENASSLSFRQLFELLRSSEDFADWYSDTLVAFEATALYWELPPLTNSTIDHEAEFVLIDAPWPAFRPSRHRSRHSSKNDREMMWSCFLISVATPS